MVGLVLTGLALLVSIGFNLLQLKWRNDDKAEQKHKDEAREAERRRKEEAPPAFYSFGGTPGPIPITGSQHSPQGRDLWGLVTVVNPTQGHMKITPRRLVMAATDWPALSISFHVKSNPRDRSDRISLMGNSKEDYELHLKFPTNNCPTGNGELWVASDNRPDEFSVPLKFP
jgi:hypothetical protein